MFQDSQTVKDADARLQVALAKLRRVRAAESVRLAVEAYNIAKLELAAARLIDQKSRRDGLVELTDNALQGRLHSARAYVYECHMGDYSSGSISNSQTELTDVKAVLRDRGIDPDSIPHRGY